MAFGNNGRKSEELRLNISPMIDVVFLILIYFIVSMQMEPSLDNIIKLPPVFNAVEQDTALLQIYVLPAKVQKGGYIDPDSTGLVAFSDKAKTPAVCPNCELPLKDKRGLYITNSLLDSDNKPVEDLQTKMAEAYGEGTRPPAFFCSRCGHEISPYLRLDEIPRALREKKKEVVEQMVQNENVKRKETGQEPMSNADVDKLEKKIKLLIKADQNAFYGRILQVVNMAKDTACDIRNFAFVTLPEASKEVAANSEQTQGDK
ncbi:MAG: hypothetical protein GF401_04225 [Chitinivibrionales bacterium]|nr:hypothetical protein [Chitinivibrionales bacterium]